MFEYNVVETQSVLVKTLLVKPPGEIDVERPWQNHHVVEPVIREKGH